MDREDYCRAIAPRLKGPAQVCAKCSQPVQRGQDFLRAHLWGQIAYWHWPCFMAAMRERKLLTMLAACGPLLLYAGTALAATSNVAQPNTLYTTLLAMMPVIGAICMIAGGTGVAVMWMFGMREFGNPMFWMLGMFVGGIVIAMIRELGRLM